MRLIVIKQASDLRTLSAGLLKKPAASRGSAHELSQATLEQVKLLNPHLVDLQHLQAGTVLLLPDSPELSDADSQPLAGTSFDDFVADVSEGFKAVTQGMRISADELAAERSAVNAVLKTAAVKRQIESDPLLKKQLEEAGNQFTDAQKNAQEAASQVEAMQKEMGDEFKALKAMLG
jgi:hypothetical protein